MSKELIFQGDARHLESFGFQPASVDCFITSPPYFNLKRYSPDAQEELGQDQDLATYLGDLESIFSSCHRLAKTTGVLWLVADTFREPEKEGGLGELVPLPFLIADAAQKAGWRLQEVIIWEKNKTLPYSGQGKLRNLMEYVLLMTKGQRFKHRPFRVAERHGVKAEWLAGWPERYHPLGKRPSNIWKIPIPTQGMWAHSERLHFCPLPQELVARCIDLTTDKGDLVVDPFAGIGTVPAQAEAMGRHGRGIELNSKFIEIFNRQLLPTFQANWEKDAKQREMARKDQLREAETLFRLRALKAGKELSRLLERWVLERPDSDAAGTVMSLVVEGPSEYARYLDVSAGETLRPPVQVKVLSEGQKDERKLLGEETANSIKVSPFSTLGLDLSCEVLTPQEFEDSHAHEPLYEFDQSRRASFTASFDLTQASSLPRLLTTISLDRVVQGDKLSPLDVARQEAERRVLMSELALVNDVSSLADRLGLPESDVHQLLMTHGIDNAEETFAIPIKLPATFQEPPAQPPPAPAEAEA